MGSAEFYPDETPVHERTVDELRDRRAPGDERAVRRVRRGDRLRDGRRAPPRPGGLPRRRPARPRAGRARVHARPPAPSTCATGGSGGAGARARAGGIRSAPESSVDDKPTHPVVQVSLEDASSYAEWAGKLGLPTEAEFEYAARGGLDGARFAWGDEDAQAEPTHGEPVAGARSRTGTRAPRAGSARRPVMTFPANGYGLYDVTGNVWEWTTDYYAPRHEVPGATPVDAGGRENLLAAASAEPGSRIPRRVLKGGRTSARPSTACATGPRPLAPGRRHGDDAHRVPLRTRRVMPGPAAGVTFLRRSARDPSFRRGNLTPPSGTARPPRRRASGTPGRRPRAR